MRLFYLPFILVSGTALAIPCTEADIVANANRNDCDSLIVNGPAPIVISGGSALVFTNIPGNVEINTNIILDGGNGGTNVTDPDAGGVAGPGASKGGGFSLGSNEPGGTGSASDGKAPVPETLGSPCSNGGGGAGLYSNGGIGGTCVTAVEPQAQGGDDAVTSGLFDFTGGLFRGGFGGGAGAYGSDSAVGAGGGGGGAIHIEALGTITIKSGVKISTLGGNGGNATINGGGGGGGSGGAVWLVSATGINLYGSIDTRGGTGGRNNTTGAHGGNGSDGRFRLDVNGDVTDGHGLATGNSSTGKKLTSDISCGTVGMTKNNNETFQMITGFAFALMMGAMIKILFQHPRKL